MEVSEYYINSRNRNSGQIQIPIPAFGDWDKAKDLPITQYFESARQAGLIRYSSSSGESGPCAAAPPSSSTAPASRNRKRHPHPHPHPRPPPPPPPHLSLKDHRIPIQLLPQLQLELQGGKVLNDDVTEPGVRRNRKPKQNLINDASLTPRLNARPPKPKPVDEDLYKIPPQLLHSSKRQRQRNKMKGLFSRCLVPACN